MNNAKPLPLSPVAGLFLHSHASGRTHGCSATPSCNSVSVSSGNPVVLNVEPYTSSFDPFLSTAAEWPANTSRWDEVYHVPTSFNARDIPIWTPLTTPEGRHQGLGDKRVAALIATAPTTHLRTVSTRSRMQAGASTPN